MAFAEFTDMFAMQQDFAGVIEAAIAAMLAAAGVPSEEPLRTANRLV